MADEPGAQGADCVPVATAYPAIAARPRRRVPRLVDWLLTHSHLLALAAGLTLVWFFGALVWDPEAVQRYGYLGIFVTTLIATGGIVLPVPYLLAVAAAGMVLNPLLVGLVAGLASALGELTGYLVGFAGLPIVRRSRWRASIERWVERRGFWAIFMLSVAPNPLFDAAGIAAGSLGMGIWSFLLACFLGKTLRLTFIAWLASRAPALLGPWLR